MIGTQVSLSDTNFVGDWDDSLVVKRVLRTGGQIIRLISNNSAWWLVC
jgi:hypothetical protein